MFSAGNGVAPGSGANGEAQPRTPAPTQPLDPLSFGSERVVKRDQLTAVSYIISTCYKGFPDLASDPRRTKWKPALNFNRGSFPFGLFRFWRLIGRLIGGLGVPLERFQCGKRMVLGIGSRHLRLEYCARFAWIGIDAQQ